MCIKKCITFSPAEVEGVQYHPPNAPWPNTEVIKTMPFDYTIHDPKYDDISIVYCPGFKPRADGMKSANKVFLLAVYLLISKSSPGVQSVILQYYSLLSPLLCC